MKSKWSKVNRLYKIISSFTYEPLQIWAYILHHFTQKKKRIIFVRKNLILKGIIIRFRLANLEIYYYRNINCTKNFIILIGFDCRSMVGLPQIRNLIIKAFQFLWNGKGCLIGQVINKTSTWSAPLFYKECD